MFIAYFETTAGRISIGLVDIAKDQLHVPLEALMNTLATVQDPIVLTNTHTELLEAPAGTPTTLTFKYLGSRSVEFPNDGAFVESVNAHLARSVFECPAEFKTAADGVFTAECEYFELVSQETPRTAPPVLH